MGNFHLAVGTAPLPRLAGLCLALLSSSDVFNKCFMQERTWDPLPAWNWGWAN